MNAEAPVRKRYLLFESGAAPSMASSLRAFASRPSKTGSRRTFFFNDKGEEAGISLKRLRLRVESALRRRAGAQAWAGTASKDTGSCPAAVSPEGGHFVCHTGVSGRSQESPRFRSQPLTLDRSNGKRTPWLQSFSGSFRPLAGSGAGAGSSQALVSRSG